MPMDEVALRIKHEDVSKLKMVNNNALVEVFDNRAMQNGVHIVITQDNPFIPDRGVVVCKADNVTCINVNDCVIIERYKGRRVYSDDDRQFILLNVGHILAICEHDDVLRGGAEYADNQTMMPCC